MSNAVASVRTYSLTISRDTPYLGPVREGETPNSKGYFVRAANGTVYPLFDRTVVVRIETGSGVVGWGETYGLVAPGAVGAIIGDLLSDFLIGRDPTDPTATYDFLYDLMRVRGYTGGFYVDALAAIDIALWDIAGKIADQPVKELLGGARRDEIPAYFSGLPEPTIKRRSELACEWQAAGFNDFKFASAVADGGMVGELESLRHALGPEARIAVDMHWKHSADDALEYLRAMSECDPWFAEAPVRTEDIAGLETVCRGSGIPIAVGEEWRTHHDMIHRTSHCPIAIVQPEMGHKGITNFMRIGRIAEESGIEVIPHSTVGAGIFLAASLQASSALAPVTAHEYQNSIFEPNRRLLESGMDCSDGRFTVPDGPGLGVEPTKELLGDLVPI